MDGYEFLEAVAVKVDKLGKLDAANLVVARAGRGKLGLAVLFDKAVELALVGGAGGLVGRVVNRGGRGGVRGVLGRVGLLVGLAGLGAARAVARRARIVLGRGVVSEELPLSVLVEASSSFLGVLTVTLSAGFSALVSSFLTTVVLKFWTVLPLVSSILQL